MFLGAQTGFPYIIWKVGHSNSLTNKAALFHQIKEDENVDVFEFPQSIESFTGMQFIFLFLQLLMFSKSTQELSQLSASKTLCPNILQYSSHIYEILDRQYVRCLTVIGN